MDVVKKGHGDGWCNSRGRRGQGKVKAEQERRFIHHGQTVNVSLSLDSDIVDGTHYYSGITVSVYDPLCPAANAKLYVVSKLLDFHR